MVVSLQDRGRLFDRLVSLQFLLADIEQADARTLQAKQGAGEHLTHHRELHQVFGRAFDVGAKIQHHATAVLGRTQRGDGRTIDAGQRAQDVLRHGHQGPGVARRNHRIGLAVDNGIDGPAHAAVAPIAQGRRRLFATGDDRRRRPHLRGAPNPRIALQQGLDALRVAEQQEARVRQALQCGVEPRHDHSRGVIPAHGIDGNADHFGHVRAKPESPSRNQAAAGAKYPAVMTGTVNMRTRRNRDAARLPSTSGRLRTSGVTFRMDEPASPGSAASAPPPRPLLIGFPGKGNPLSVRRATCVRARPGRRTVPTLSLGRHHPQAPGQS